MSLQSQTLRGCTTGRCLDASSQTAPSDQLSLCQQAQMPSMALMLLAMYTISAGEHLCVQMQAAARGAWSGLGKLELATNEP